MMLVDIGHDYIYLMSDCQLSQSKFFNVNNLKLIFVKAIEERIAKFISDRDLLVLREKKTGRALNVSYTEDGLKYTTSLSGRLIYFTDA